MLLSGTEFGREPS